MTSITDTRQTTLQIVNEAFGKIGIRKISSFTDNAEAAVALDYLNDVIDEVIDYGKGQGGGWKELMRTVLVTSSTSVNVYDIDVSAPIHSIFEIAYQGDVAPMRYRTVEEMRRWGRINSTGRPRFWSILEINASSGDPRINVYPNVASNEAGKTFDIYYQKKIETLVTADTSVIPSLPSRMLVQGLMAELLRDESRGTQNLDYAIEREKFLERMMEAYDRFHGDSGGDTYFRPRRTGFRRV